MKGICQDQIAAVQMLFTVIPPQYQSWIHRMLAVPITYMTPFNDAYHAYLIEIFHQNRLTMLSHALFVPLQVVCWMLVANQISMLTVHSPSVGAMGFAVILCLYYLTWGVVVRKYLFGWCCMLCTYLLHTMASIFTPFVISNSWVHFCAPLILGIASCWCLSIGHAYEDCIPPFVSTSMHWVDRKKWLQDKSRFYLLGTVAYGALDEFLAFWHVYPMLILRFLCTMGYEPQYWEELNKHVQQCIASGQPNVHCIQIGGGSYHHFQSAGVAIPKKYC